MQNTVGQDLLQFIKEHENWQELLKEAPRHIRIKQCPLKDDFGNLKYPELYMLSYDGIFSNFNDPLVRACRGSIISLQDPKNPIFACWPFEKFGNYGESYCPTIDWESAVVMDKADGILIKLFNYKNEWIWVTNNGWNIQLSLNEIAQLPSKYVENEIKNCNTVKNIIDYSCNKVDFQNTDVLNINYTYMFELVSTKCRILVDNKKTELIYLASRNNKTGFETELNEAYLINPELQKFKTIEYFDLKNIEDTLALCNSYDDDTKEGVVIRDKYFNRVKIKCKHYIMLKGYRNGFCGTEKQIFEAIVKNEIDDVITIFPEIQTKINEIKSNIEKYKNFIENIWMVAYKQFLYLSEQINDIREVKKIFAQWVNTVYPKYTNICFNATKSVFDFKIFLKKITYEEIKEILKENQ